MTTNWEDRRGMFQAGKQVHEPGKKTTEFGTPRKSIDKSSLSGSVAEAVRRSSTSSGDGGNSPSRRRSSAASGGLFGNLTQHKRGSEDYGTRRQSHIEQHPGGMMSGWFNSTFKGVASGKPDATTTTATQSERKGVME